LTCTHLRRVNAVGQKAAEAKAALEDLVKQAAWTNTCIEWEAAFESTPLGRKVVNSRERFSLPSVTTAVRSSYTSGAMFLGIFWPADVCLRIKGQEIPDALKIVHTQSGRGMTGIILPNSEGYVEGCIELKDVDERGVTIERRLADSSQAFAKAP
jgi:hypothetical protein